MFKPLKHPNVKILGGLPVFIGQTGVIVDKEGKLYRVKLDTPVEVPDVGLVTDDLWEPKLLKVIRPPVEKPAKPQPAPATVKLVAIEGEPVMSTEDVAQRLEQLANEPVEAPVSEDPANPSDETLREMGVLPQKRTVDRGAVVRKPKAAKAPKAAKGKKAKAPSAKAEAQARAGVKVTKH